MADIGVARVDNVVTNAVKTVNKERTDKGFKFTLLANIEQEELRGKLKGMIDEISEIGDKIARHMDIKDMRLYREKIRTFMNEAVSNSHSFSRENFLDSRGRHRVYGIIRLVDSSLDDLTKQLLSDEKNHMSILGKVDEIRGMLLDLII